MQSANFIHNIFFLKSATLQNWWWIKTRYVVSSFEHRQTFKIHSRWWETKRTSGAVWILMLSVTVILKDGFWHAHEFQVLLYVFYDCYFNKKGILSLGYFLTTNNVNKKKKHAPVKSIYGIDKTDIVTIVNCRFPLYSRMNKQVMD